MVSKNDRNARSRRRTRPILGGALGAWLALAGAAGSSTPDAAADPAQLCEQAAWQASQATGVPLTVMQAISLTETGRKRGGAFRPWPWTVNMEGKGAWFDSRAEAHDFVTKHHDRGARSFDVGCFQINYKWHGQHFASIEQMFDPLANAFYAARFLTELHAETGSWTEAAGAYHSRTPEHAERYTAIFERHRARIAADPNADIPVIPDIVARVEGRAVALPGAPVRPAAPRVNTYPLLQAGAVTMPGSLVPVANGRGASLFSGRSAGSLFGGDGG